MAEIKNYPSNSIKSREAATKKQKPEITPVIEEGDAKVVPLRLWRKIFNAFFPTAVDKPVGTFFLYDVAIPTVRNFVGSMLISGGKNISGYNNGDVFGSGKKSYENYYNGKVSYLNSPMQKRNKIYDSERVWYSSLAKGQEVVDSMNDVLKVYPVVSVADMKEFSKLSEEINPGDHHIGWSDIKDVKWYSDHGGYTFVFPPTTDI